MGLSEYKVEAALAVSDLDRAKRFYEDQLGLVPGVWIAARPLPPSWPRA